MQVALLLSIFLLGFSHFGHAEQHQHRVAQQKSYTKGKDKSHASHKKFSGKQGKAHNMLYPFILRLLYTPSYRFLSEYMRDTIDKSSDLEESKVSMEVAQFLPISLGLEGEFTFNQWVSLAVGGSFTWQDEFITYEHNSEKIKNIFKQKGIHSSSKFYEYVVGSSLYGNVFNHFKLGVGAELAFRVWDHISSQTEKGKKWEDKNKMTWKRVSAHLALRRDFFLSRFGFGVGLNASLPLSDMLDRQSENKRYIDGKQQKIEDSNTDDNGDDDNDEGLYSVTLMPTLYVAF